MVQWEGVLIPLVWNWGFNSQSPHSSSELLVTLQPPRYIFVLFHIFIFVIFSCSLMVEVNKKALFFSHNLEVLVLRRAL